MHLRRLLAVPVVALLLTTLLPGSASARQRAETWQVPAGSVITIDGHGYGHGHGLSQYGALGAADQGLGWKEIVSFYYPGTAWGQAKGRLRVLLTADTSADLQVVVQPRLRVRKLTDGRLWELPARRAKKWRLAGRGERTKVQFTRGRGWITWRTFRSEAEFSSRSGPMTIVLPGGHRASYRGRLRSVAPRIGEKRQSVNVLGLEAYLRGVVPREVPALWHPEAVSAQSVAARTYAAFERSHPSAPHYDICDTTMCQVYGGRDAEHPAADAAIKATARQVVTHGDRPAFTQFSASSGGWTSAGSMPYLVAQPDPYDDNPRNPVHSWTRDVVPAAVERHWPRLGELTGIEVRSRDGNGEWGGRVGTLVLTGTEGTVNTTGDTFRSALGLRSSWFTFSVSTSSAPRLAS